MHVNRDIVPIQNNVCRIAEKNAFGGHSLPQRPEAVAALLRAGIVSSKLIFPEAGGYKQVETWLPPESIDQNEIKLARDYYLELEAFLSPATRSELLSRVLALLSHYRLEVHSAQIEACIADDWAEDLGDYPMWAVNHAARVWRRTKRFKPQVSEILDLCEGAVRPFREDHNRLRALLARRTRNSNVHVVQVPELASTISRPVP